MIYKIGKDNIKMIHNLIKNGYNKKQVYNLFDGALSMNEINKAFRSFMMDDEIVSEKEENTLKESIQKHHVNHSKKVLIQDDYDFLIMEILKGKSISEICRDNKNCKEEYINRMLDKLEFVASHKRKYSDGSWLRDEKIIELLKTVRRKDVSSTTAKIRREIQPYGILRYGRIDNIIINIFDENQYKAYYLFTKMKNQIIISREYDGLVYDRIGRETKDKLDFIAEKLRLIEGEKVERHIIMKKKINDQIKNVDTLNKSDEETR